MGQAQFIGIGVSVELGIAQRPALPQSPGFQPLRGSRRHFIPGRRGLGAVIQPKHRFRCRQLSLVKALQPALLTFRAQSHPVGRKDHPIETLCHELGVAVQHQHIGSCAIQPDLQQSLHAARGIQPASRNQFALVGTVHACAGLAVQKAGAAAAFEPKEREGGVPDQVVHRLHRSRHWASSAARAAISLRRNRLIN